MLQEISIHPQKLLNAEAFHRGTRDFGSTMDGFCDQQVPFMVPGVSWHLCHCVLDLLVWVLFLLEKWADLHLPPFLHLNLHLLASFRNLGQRNVEDDL